MPDDSFSRPPAPDAAKRGAARSRRRQSKHVRHSPELAVVVLAVGAPKETVTAVRSLLNQSPPVEIVVVNSGGGDMGRRLREAGIDVKVVERAERLYVGAARNLGIEATRATYVAFLASDCRATPGWARQRLKAHREGHLAVGSAVANSNPGNPFAWAHHFSLWPRRLPTLKENGLAFGASYHRWLFKKYGMFRPDLRTAEDSEFHYRLRKDHEPVWRPQVRTIHANPTGFFTLLRDQYQRGSRAARAGFELKRPPFPRNLLAWGWRRAAFSVRTAVAHAPKSHRLAVYLSLPFIPLAAAAYCLGVVRWHRDNRVPLGRRHRAAPEPQGEVNPMITRRTFKGISRIRNILRRRPKLIALFSYRYDAHLVPDLIENIRPIVDGYAAFDDRFAETEFSNETLRRRALIDAARAMRARWVVFIDPDERLERDAGRKIFEMLMMDELVVFGFRLREMFAADAYRVDGQWGEKCVYRLFPLLDGQEFDTRTLHGPHYPLGYLPRRTDINLYHLKMIAPARRIARRDLYKRLDPERRFQSIGYDYLADDDGAVLERIPPGREYHPTHVDDGGLWMADAPAESTQS